MFHDYPYTDAHELNLDWIIGKIKHIDDTMKETEEFMEAAQAAQAGAETAQENAETAQSKAEDAQEAAETAQGKAEDAVDAAEAVVVDTLHQIELLQARVDNIIPDGTQTEGNTELLDIRVGFNGQIYDSAGNAVRGQVTRLKDALKEFSDFAIFPYNLVNFTDYVDEAYINTNNGNVSTGHTGYFCTGFIPVTAGTTYKANVGRNYAWYELDETYISGASGTAIQTGITAPSDAAFIRFTVNKSSDGIDDPILLYFTESADFSTDEIFGIDIPGTINTALNPVNAEINAIKDTYIRGTQFDDNLVDPTDYVDDAYINMDNGKVAVDHVGYFCTGYIPVTAETTYKANVGRNSAWYDSSKVFISSNDDKSIQSGIVAPEGAAYIRFTVNKSRDGIETPYFLYFTDVDSFKDTYIFGLKIPDEYHHWCYGKLINWIGDSIVAGSDFDEIVSNALGMTETDYGINGSTIALKGDGTDGRNAICERYVSMTDTTDIIAVSAGTNDWMYAWCPIGDITDPDDGTSNDTFYGALKTLCKGLIDKYPEKTIFFTTPIKRAQSFEDGNGGTYTPDNVMTTPFSKNKYGKTLGDYANIIKEVCGYYSIPVLDLYNESMLNPSLTSQQDLFDNVLTHPNSDGRKMMARRVCGWLTQLSFKIN